MSRPPRPPRPCAGGIVTVLVVVVVVLAAAGFAGYWFLIRSDAAPKPDDQGHQDRRAAARSTAPGR